MICFVLVFCCLLFFCFICYVLGVVVVVVMLWVVFVVQVVVLLKIGYSDWFGWVVFQVVFDKGWFKEVGVDVDFEWFDYLVLFDVFFVGKFDVVVVINGDVLVIGVFGVKNVMILLIDYLVGNDMIVVKLFLCIVEVLKGKKVGVEFGLVDYLLFEIVLQKYGFKDGDVMFVNVKINELLQVFGLLVDIVVVVVW